MCIISMTQRPCRLYSGLQDNQGYSQRFCLKKKKKGKWLTTLSLWRLVFLHYVSHFHFQHVNCRYFFKSSIYLELLASCLQPYETKERERNITECLCSPGTFLKQNIDKNVSVTVESMTDSTKWDFKDQLIAYPIQTIYVH